MANEFHENIPAKIPVFTFFPSVFATRLRQDVSYSIANMVAVAEVDTMKYFIAASESVEGGAVTTGVVCEVQERKRNMRNVSFKILTLFQVAFDRSAGEMRNGLLHVSWLPFRLYPISAMDMHMMEFGVAIQALIHLFHKFIRVLEDHADEHRLLLDSYPVKLASQNILRGVNVNKLDRTLNCVMDAVAMLFTLNAKGEKEELDAEKKQFFQSVSHDFLHEHFVKNRLAIVLLTLHQLVGDDEVAGEGPFALQDISVGERGASGGEKDYRARFDDTKKHIPEEKWPQIEREISYASGGDNANARVSQQYLERVLWMPWGAYTEDTKDLVKVQRMLDEDHTGLVKVKDQILEFLAIRRLNPSAKGSILCLVGPPGVGKTSIGKSVARALGRKFARMALGGVRDEAELRGHRRTYIGAVPGKIAMMISDAGSFNPVIVLDEGDKVGSHFGHDDVASALLEILDPEQNFSFVDDYLEIPIDLSRVFFLITANLVEPILPALRDRMTIIRLSGYAPQEKLAIATNHLIPKQRKECGIPIDQDGKKLDVTFTEGAVSQMIQQYTYEAGVRNLEKTIHGIFGKIDKDFFMNPDSYGSDEIVKITQQNLHVWCGKALHRESPLPAALSAGVVPGLGVTDAGGHVFLIEVKIGHHQERKIKITGVRASHDSKESVNLIDESLLVAFGFFSSDDGILCAHIRALEEKLPLYVQGNLTDNTPKDGPSAGLPIALALYGALTKRVLARGPNSKFLAATGAISLSGAVSAVGGIRDKVLAAHRAGIGRILLPKENEQDIEDIPTDVRSNMELIPVSTIAEALAIAFPTEPAVK